MEEGLRLRLFCSGLGRMGKTTVLRPELVPDLEARAAGFCAPGRTPLQPPNVVRRNAKSRLTSLPPVSPAPGPRQEHPVAQLAPFRYSVTGLEVPEWRAHDSRK